MRKMPQVSTGIATAERKWMFPLLASVLAMLILLLAGTSRLMGHSEAFYKIFSLGRPGFESRSTVVLKGPDSPPVLAYLISGTRGDGGQMKRLLNAVYHPRNQYLLHLDCQAPDAERVKLALYAKSDRVFRVMDNVNVVGKADAVTFMGSTAIASTLHAAAILLRISTDWDWFITLSAMDYPLITQDDLLYVLSYLPRDLNFIEHTSDLGWKEYQRAKPIIIDPGLYLSRKSEIFYTSQRREMPDTYKVFTGFLRMLYEYCQEIQQHELTLQDMQAMILPRKSLPLYCLRPIIELLRKIRKILKKTIHIHERDAHKKMRNQLQEQLS